MSDSPNNVGADKGAAILEDGIAYTVSGWLSELPMTTTELHQITNEQWQELYTALSELFRHHRLYDKRYEK